jgi:hypothetical protein
MKVIAIAESNQATKMNFLLTRKQGVDTSRMKPNLNHDDSGSMSDDGQSVDLDDNNNTESPPPGTIVPQKKHSSNTTTRKSTASNDGGLFIPESVRLSAIEMIHCIVFLSLG